ncbi:hypothetical protein M758_3G161000 [Ceratodon purpureus]|nr:hypothetical protein M758_3G161000 [Ceratodon purpureus]
MPILLNHTPAKSRPAITIDLDPHIIQENKTETPNTRLLARSLGNDALPHTTSHKSCPNHPIPLNQNCTNHSTQKPIAPTSTPMCALILQPTTPGPADDDRWPLRVDTIRETKSIQPASNESATTTAP